MSRLTAAVSHACRFFAQPKRGSLWTCSKCGTKNESFRSKCMNGCG